MNFLINLIGKKFVMGIGATVVIGFGIHYFMLMNEIENLEHQLTEYKVAIKDYQQNEKDFLNTIQEQNESIEKQKQKAEDLLARTKQLEEKRERQEEIFEQKLDDIENQDIGSTCKESMNYLREFPNNR
jgi:chromosome segregation ATPase